ncbi:unnamed protein product [Vitrella brassicaformis CCMP3155]|uniref:Hexosyltransferase n=3 Tax=Vitrella brassicaformis TaxID=1169539 RepID=A0A0G4F7H7_VITBC|nr:unnamed protein product [Vitrella brassicaformis CCMP3155]|eukprot:CEM08629.1 unnamed protein product [Vitrella brassicaformis CCMP3155]
MPPLSDSAGPQPGIDDAATVDPEVPCFRRPPFSRPSDPRGHAQHSMPAQLMQSPFGSVVGIQRKKRPHQVCADGTQDDPDEHKSAADSPWERSMRACWRVWVRVGGPVPARCPQKGLRLLVVVSCLSALGLILVVLWLGLGTTTASEEGFSDGDNGIPRPLAAPAAAPVVEKASRRVGIPLVSSLQASWVSLERWFRSQAMLTPSKNMGSVLDHLDASFVHSPHRGPHRTAAHGRSLVELEDALADTYSCLVGVGILSRASNFHLRDAIRATWASREAWWGDTVIGHSKTVFVLDRPPTNESALSDDVAARVMAEAQQHGDIIYLTDNGAETGEGYEQILRKTWRIFQWASQDTDCQIIFKTDDDSYLHLPRLMSSLLTESQRGSLDRLWVGFFTVESPVHLEWYSKYYAREYYLHTGLQLWPAFAQGAGYGLSRDVAELLIDMDRKVGLKFFSMEDATVGTWLTPLNLNKLPLSLCTCHDVDRAFFRGRPIHAFLSALLKPFTRAEKMSLRHSRRNRKATMDVVQPSSRSRALCETSYTLIHWVKKPADMVAIHEAFRLC